jgi:phosphate/sulfate permease
VFRSDWTVEQQKHIEDIIFYWAIAWISLFILLLVLSPLFSATIAFLVLVWFGASALEYASKVKRHMAGEDVKELSRKLDRMEKHT